MKRKNYAALVLVVSLGIGSTDVCIGQTADTAQISVPSLNMPPDQQLQLAQAIYQLIVAQGGSPATLVLVDDAGAQVSFDTTALSGP